MSELPTYATAIPRPERFDGPASRKRYKRYSKVSWTCFHEVEGAREVAEHWIAFSDDHRPMHWMSIVAEGGGRVEFDRPDDPVALAKLAIAFLSQHHPQGKR